MVLGVWALIFLVAFFAVFAVDLPDTSKLYDVKRQPSISYLDRSGALVAVRGSQYAPPVDLDSLPPYVPAAFVAIEDRRFWYHPGFDPIGIGRDGWETPVGTTRVSRNPAFANSSAYSPSVRSRPPGV